MSLPPKKLTVTYFPMGGRAEAIRLACVIGKIPFTNKSVSGKDFGAMKASLPLGQLPILEVEEEGKEPVVIPQSNAVLRYVSKLGGLYPTDMVQAARVDSILDSLEDLYRPLFLSAAGKVKFYISETDFTDDEKKEMRLRIIQKHFPKFLTHLENLAKETGTGFIVGETPTIADLVIYSFQKMLLSSMIDNIPSDTLSAYPSLMKVVETLEAIPEVKAFYEKYPMPYPTFDYVP